MRVLLICTTFMLVFSLAAWAQVGISLPFSEDFQATGGTDWASLDARGWDTSNAVGNSDISLSSTDHTGNGSRSLYDADDVNNLGRWIETYWPPVQPEVGTPIVINWWWRHDSTGSSNQHDCKEVDLYNNGGGQAGSAEVRWGPYTFSFGALWARMVGTNSWASIDAGNVDCQNIYDRTGTVWQEWVITINTTDATFTVGGSDYLACGGLGGSGAPGADLLTYPINRIQIGVQANWGNRRGIFWFDDLSITGPAPGVDDWAVY